VFDHLSIGVTNLDLSAEFDDACLAPPGYVRLWRHPRAAGYGPEGYEAEAPFAKLECAPGGKAPGGVSHIAFLAPSRDAVDGFHGAALSKGGVDEGAPGIRENYDPGYYATFIRDPNGPRHEAVLHES